MTASVLWTLENFRFSALRRTDGSKACRVFQVPFFSRERTASWTRRQQFAQASTGSQLAWRGFTFTHTQRFLARERHVSVFSGLWVRLESAGV